MRLALKIEAFSRSFSSGQNSWVVDFLSKQTLHLQYVRNPDRRKEKKHWSSHLVSSFLRVNQKSSKYIYKNLKSQRMQLLNWICPNSSWKTQATWTPLLKTQATDTWLLVILGPQPRSSVTNQPLEDDVRIPNQDGWDILNSLDTQVTAYRTHGDYQSLTPGSRNITLPIPIPSWRSLP